MCKRTIRRRDEEGGGTCIVGTYRPTSAVLRPRILAYNDRDVTHLRIKWGVVVGPTVIGAGTRHLPPSPIHAPVTNPR